MSCFAHITKFAFLSLLALSQAQAASVLGNLNTVVATGQEMSSATPVIMPSAAKVDLAAAQRWTALCDEPTPTVGASSPLAATSIQSPSGSLFTAAPVIIERAAWCPPAPQCTIPEPSQVSALLGLGALLVASWRRARS